jgi:methionyl-tRNA formyltransferase
MKIQLFVLGFKALECLKSLSKESYDKITHITIGHDKNIRYDYSDQIIQFCLKNGINYSERFDNKVTDANFLLAIGWRWLIDKHPDQKLIVFHDSLLPRYRGFNPLVTSLINGDREIGVTALFGTNEYDKGDIISQWKKQIEYPMKIQSAIEIVSRGYSKLFLDIFKKISEGKEFKGKPQDERFATYSVWRDKEDYYIDWNQSSERIKRVVDALSFPYLSARSRIECKEVLIEDVEVVNDLIIENRNVGKVLFNSNCFPIVICGKGLLMVKKIFNSDREELFFKDKLRIRFS